MTITLSTAGYYLYGESYGYADNFYSQLYEELQQQQVDFNFPKTATRFWKEDYYEEGQTSEIALDTAIYEEIQPFLNNTQLAEVVSPEDNRPAEAQFYTFSGYNTLWVRFEDGTTVMVSVWGDYVKYFGRWYHLENSQGLKETLLAAGITEIDSN